MKMAKLVVCLGTVAMAWASASKSYDVTLNNPAQVSGNTFRGQVKPLDGDGTVN